MNNFLIDDYNINENYAIEASAGTGKTYNVIKMVEKMLNGGVNLNEILIVTYTDKACGELKDRIKQIELEDGTNVDINLSNIYTIHSFCLNTIKEFGISAKLPLTMEMLEDDVLDRFANLYIQKNVLSDIRYLKNIGFNLDIITIKKMLIDSCNKYYLNNNLEEEKSIISLGDSSYDLNPIKTIAFMNVENIGINDILKIFKKIDTCFSIEDFYGLLPNLEENLEFFNCNPDDKTSTMQNFYDDFSNLSTIKQGFKFDGRKIKKKEIKDTDEFKYLKSLKDFFTQKNSYIGYTYIFYKHVKKFYIEFLNYKSINKQESFNDMIRYVREGLKEDDFVSKIGRAHV